MIFDHESPEYAKSWNKLGRDKYNGAYYYAKEIKENIMPLVKTVKEHDVACYADFFKVKIKSLIGKELNENRS